MTTTLRPCLECGTLTTGSRCKTHTTRNGSTRSWRHLRARVLRRDRYQCQVTKGCTRIATTVDHILPLVRGGTDSERNLQAACAQCNTSKGAKAA